MRYADLRGIYLWTGSLNPLVSPDAFHRATDADKRMLEVTGSEDVLDQFTNRDLEFLLQL